MEKSTRNQYKKLLSQLKRWAWKTLGQLDLSRLSQSEIEKYESYLISEQELSSRSVNNHRQAINLFYKKKGLSVRLTLRSVSVHSTVIDTINRQQVQAIIQTIPEFYRPVLNLIYADLVPPGQAIKHFPSPHGSYISLQAVNNQIAIATQRCGIDKHVRAKIVHQSGIIHRLEDEGVPVVAEMTGLRPNTIARYLKQVKNSDTIEIKE